MLKKLSSLWWSWRYRQRPPSPLFDPEWYRAVYQDVTDSGVDPWIHYTRFGQYEGREPSAGFSASGYRYALGLEDSVNVFEHYAKSPCESRLYALPSLEGKLPFQSGRPVVLLVGHQAGLRLYGAERSLLDLMRIFRALQINVVVALPSAVNGDYVREIQSNAWQVAVAPYGWWREGRRPVVETVDHFSSLIDRYGVDIVYANTLMLDEPLLAAKTAGLPLVVHVREVLAVDKELNKAVSADSESAGRRLKSLTNELVANSRFTAESLDCQNATIIPNCIDTSVFDNVPSPLSHGGETTIGMVSSNLPKKGLEDFVQVANTVYSQAPDLKFNLIGPDNRHVRRIRELQRKGEASPQIAFCGYVASPSQAMEQIDMVLNLSRVPESFGRTVVEAMAARRPVIAYHHGALPELVVPNETGFLVPLGDTDKVASLIIEIANDPDRLLRLGQRGKDEAEKRFHFSGVTRRMADLMTRILETRIHQKRSENQSQER